MNVLQRKKMGFLLISLLVLIVVVGLVMYALRQNISLFYTPKQLVDNQAPTNVPIRLGGIVVQGSVHHSSQDLVVDFQLTDYKSVVTVFYKGILPDLFREGQGIVAKGRWLPNNQFQATEVLAKHDANYMPPELKKSLLQEKSSS